jgi:hypothetical protein
VKYTKIILRVVYWDDEQNGNGGTVYGNIFKKCKITNWKKRLKTEMTRRSPFNPLTPNNL